VFLSDFINPIYLQSKTIASLSQKFADESSLELHTFLATAIAEKLQKGLHETDVRDGLSGERNGKIPPHEAGTKDAWIPKGPPHKWRYCSLEPSNGSGKSAENSPDQIVRSLQDELFSSTAFRAWLACISRLLPLGYAVEARRFRPGLDYTLATSDEKDARLDDEEPTGWQAGEWGGWEVRNRCFG
jgi:hypothetical protein